MPAKAAVKKKPKATRRSTGRSQVVSKGRRRAAGTSSADLKKFRDILLAEEERLELELQEIESRAARAGESERPNEISSYDDLPADLASVTFEREKDLAIGESVEGLLNQVRTALEKIESRTYGTCDACNRPIKKARLKALPFATLCLDCQGRLER